MESINNLIPLFAVMAVGYIAGRYKMLPEQTGSILINYLFDFAAPALFFVNIYQSTIHDVFNLRFLLAFTIGDILIIAFVHFLCRQALHIQGKGVIMRILCCFYGNLAYVGVPVFLRIFNNVGPITLALCVHTAFIFPLFIMNLEYFEHNETKATPLNCLKIIVKTPCILFSLLATIFLLCRVKIPNVVIASLSQIGAPTTTAGLFALGFNCNYGGKAAFNQKCAGEAFVIVLFKQIITPLLAFLLGKYLFGLEGFWLNSLIICAILPLALNNYILSQRYETEQDLTRMCIVLSTFLFPIIISLFVLIRGI